jgi:hypothetical protein
MAGWGDAMTAEAEVSEEAESAGGWAETFDATAVPGSLLLSIAGRHGPSSVLA